jgi:hypothetical protein
VILRFLVGQTVCSLLSAAVGICYTSMLAARPTLCLSGDEPMVDQTVPAPDLAPALPPGLSMAQRIALWADLLDACDQLLLAGLRRRIGPDGDLQAAYREWLGRQMEEHHRMLLQMIDKFNRRGRRHGQ